MHSQPVLRSKVHSLLVHKRGHTTQLLRALVSPLHSGDSRALSFVSMQGNLYKPGIAPASGNQKGCRVTRPQHMHRQGCGRMGA
jgi:hypothetical protein